MTSDLIPEEHRRAMARAWRNGAVFAALDRPHAEAAAALAVIHATPLEILRDAVARLEALNEEARG